MEDKELWKAFEKTGRILDYLHYKNLYGGEYKDYYTSSKDDTVGEGAFESESNSDRNDTVRNTYR